MLAGVPNRFTAVPRGDVPAAGRCMSPVVYAADLFMALMLSRPGGLSLRTTWVTPGSTLLTAVAAPLSLLVAAMFLARGGPGWTVAAVVVLLIAAGSAAVATVGVFQRRAAGHGSSEVTPR
jgi:hypothetical protein